MRASSALALPAAMLVMAGVSGMEAHAQPGGAGAQRPPEYTGPRIVVRRGGAPQHYVSDHASPASGPGHAIPVPSNTLHDDTPLWYTRGLQSADLRLAHGTADWVEAQADRIGRRRADIGVHSSFLYIDPLIYPWPAGASLGVVPMPMGMPGDMDGDRMFDADADAAEDDGREQPEPARPPAARDDDYTGPRITVHRNGAPRRDADRTVTRIHLPGGSFAVGSAAARGAIPVPANTLFDGPPTWYIRGMQSADLRIANATADWVEAQADRAERWGQRRR